MVNSKDPLARFSLPIERFGRALGLRVRFSVTIRLPYAADCPAEFPTKPAASEDASATLTPSPWRVVERLKQPVNRKRWLALEQGVPEIDRATHEGEWRGKSLRFKALRVILSLRVPFVWFDICA
ncbi:MAG: hypothetical protein WCH13_12310 [Deltaproteobacteria bacterium]